MTGEVENHIQSQTEMQRRQGLISRDDMQRILKQQTTLPSQQNFGASANGSYQQKSLLVSNRSTFPPAGQALKT